MKKRLFCVLMSVILCLSFSLCIFADNPICEVEEAIETVSLETYSLNSLVIPEGAVAVGYDMQTQEEFAYRVNGNIMSVEWQEEYSTESMIPAETALLMTKEAVFPRAIIGAMDSRVPVVDATVSPYCWTVLIKKTYFDIFYGREVTTYVSGCMISSDTVLTAAHCLFSTIDGWPISIEVIPAINSNNFSNKPFGSAMAIELAVATQYYSEGMKTHDWGMIKLSEHIGYESGYIGVKFMTRNMANQNVSTAGYPGDINNIENNIDGIYTDDTFYQYWVSDIITADSTENASPATYRRLKYEMDTFGGQSGSPIIYNNKCIGIHNGYSLNDDLNYAFGITSQLYSFILAYK